MCFKEEKQISSSMILLADLVGLSIGNRRILPSREVRNSLLSLGPKIASIRVFKGRRRITLYERNLRDFRYVYPRRTKLATHLSDPTILENALHLIKEKQKIVKMRDEDLAALLFDFEDDNE